MTLISFLPPVLAFQGSGERTNSTQCVSQEKQISAPALCSAHPTLNFPFYFLLSQQQKVWEEMGPWQGGLEICRSAPGSEQSFISYWEKTQFNLSGSKGLDNLEAVMDSCCNKSYPYI